MATAAQIIANQKNAQASTGPRTPEGKAASSRNALKFGLTSQQIVLPTENPADFEALHAGLINQLNPATDAESMQVDNAAIAEWRERRVERVQQAWVAAELNKHASEDPDLALSAVLLGDEVHKFHKYAAAFRREREAAWRKLAMLQKERKAEEQRQAEARRQAEILERQRMALQIKAKFEAEHPGRTLRLRAPGTIFESRRAGG